MHVDVGLISLGALTSHWFLFCGLDDSASAASSMEVTDRIASLEQRVQMQEDDIQLLKSALADVVRRLNITEEQQAVLNRKGPTKGGHLRCAGGGQPGLAAGVRSPLARTHMLEL